MLVSEDADFSKFNWKVGQRFPSRAAFRKAVSKYGILQGRNLKYISSNKNRLERLGVVCVEGCPFKLYASWDTRRATYLVKMVKSEHSCNRTMERNHQLKSSWLAQQFIEVFKSRPHWPAKEIVETVRRAYRIVIKRDVAYKVKYLAHKLLHGSMQEHYMKIGRYLEAVKASSPGTHLELYTDPSVKKQPPVFQRLYLGRDGNDQMYPIAWAIVEGENNLSWSGSSDSCKGVWHLEMGDEMKLLFWSIVKAYNEADYNDALDNLAKVSDEAAHSFKAYNPKLFCRAFMSTSTKADIVTSNLAETFNGWIINARTKHVIYMLEDIRASLMQRLVKKKQEMEKSASLICPRIKTKLEKEKIKAAFCDVLPSTETLFQVNHQLDSLIVDLEARTCTCRRWDLCGYPCCHAVAAIFFCHKEAEEFVHECYKREVYLKAYAGSIPPCEGERHWPKVSLPLDPQLKLDLVGLGKTELRTLLKILNTLGR
ncbi:uncharacterized protein LOC104893349 [Beta vulgaris subsp. vulgaris]|uniref:uncharacterized protein LOC104893349 n=1 Tax=Beta vulgaris subsp. vulgaris TaxID=3555 RepID=UPI002549A1F2|nr:uncharacterized protein LOC104893349 [Beta vulgaris subsp. vulgaris]